MRKVLPSVTALLLGYLILVMGHGLVSTLLSLRAVVEGMSTGVIGLIVSSYYAGFVVGTLHGGRVIGRAGHVRAFAAFAALACISILALPVFVDATAWIVMRLVAGNSSASKACKAASPTPCSRKQRPSLRASTMACPAPFDPTG